MYVYICSLGGEGIPTRSFTRVTTRDQIVDIKGSRAFPALLHKVQACNGDGEVAYSRRRDIERSGATGVSLFPRLSRSAAVLYWLYAFRVTRVVDTWKQRMSVMCSRSYAARREIKPDKKKAKIQK